ncbi:sensor histidine kinase [Saccharopolyspora sp. CA-218241]|uniref:sensor histidine kinase n=1 Tax=Saccharopolyspora sp. CA-218241 TaxID=3240027 RepID=UPI003D98E263
MGVPALAVWFASSDRVWPLVAGLVGAAGLVLRRHWPRTAVLVCLPAMAGGLGWAPAIVALFALGRARPSVGPLSGWVLLVSVAALAPVLLVQSLAPGAVVLTVAFVLLAAGAPVALGALVSLRARLAESLRRLEEATDAALEANAERARAEERSRIAREIHDAVGHQVTLIAVESAALGATAPDPRTAEAADRLRGLAKQALDEVRSALGLGEAARDRAALSAVPGLVESARAAGLPIELRGAVADDAVAPAAGRAAYRVVQEALTNASKHAPGAVVVVELAERDDALRVVVANEPPAAPAVDVGGTGSGLAGLAERVRVAGGTLDAGTRADGGFDVVAELPRT